jgi:capsular exopolysaccharide synthesis family protein
MSGLTSIIARHWKPLIYLNAALIVAIVGKFFLSEKTWTAKAQLILPETKDNLEANLGRLGSLKNDNSTIFSDSVNPLLAQESILTSDAVMQQVYDADPQKNKFKRLARYKELFEVEIEEQSTTIALNVEGKERDLVRKRAETWIEVYNNRLDRLRKEDAEKRSKFTTTELEESQKQLNRTQIALSNFQRSSGLVSGDEQTKEIVRVISTLTTEKLQAEAQAKAEENKVNALSTRLNLSPSQAMRSVGLGENQDYQAVRGKLKRIELELSRLRATRTDKDPAVEELLIERDDLKRQLQAYKGSPGETIDGTIASNASQGRANLIQQLVQAESTASSQRKKAEQLENKIAQLKNNLNAIPGDRSRLLELQRQQEIAEGVYQGLVAQLQQAKINAFSAYPSVQTIEPPTVDPKPTNPKIELSAIYWILAALTGSTALLLWLERRNPLLDAKDLQLFNFPTVFTIRRFRNLDINSHLDLESSSEADLDFQRLASAISLQPLSSNRLMVTSSISGEGKTTVTIGLAKALADLGFRVLLVDGDFRKAELSTSLVVDRDRATKEQIVQLLPNLDLLPTYPQQGNVIAQITQGKFEKKLMAADANGSYDYILVDSAPVSLTSEAALMATIINNVLFVVRPDYSERNSAYESVDQLQQLNAKIIGLIINGVQINSKPYYPYGNRKYLQATKE